jgi:hypothetical protein
VIVQIPDSVLPVSYAAKYSFETPLSLPSFGGKAKEEEVQDQQKESEDAGTVDEEEEDSMHVTFNAGIAGNIVYRQQQAKAQWADGKEEDLVVSLTLTSYRSLPSC